MTQDGTLRKRVMLRMKKDLLQQNGGVGGGGGGSSLIGEVEDTQNSPITGLASHGIRVGRRLLCVNHQERTGGGVGGSEVYESE